jgi:pyruvate,orthophosphate dikinase
LLVFWGGTPFFAVLTAALTQTRLGLFRDDSGCFLGAYTDDEIVTQNPFALIDQSGVRQLAKNSCAKGNQTRPGIKLGPATTRDGEHGGAPGSVKFCHKVGLTYVSPKLPQCFSATATQVGK